MNEEIEYAEMLEIPVSTVNVVRKKRRKRQEEESGELRDTVIATVNGRMQESTPAQTQNATRGQSAQADGASAPRSSNGQENPSASVEEGQALSEQTPPSTPTADGNPLPDFYDEEEGSLAFDPVPERIDTVRLYDTRGEGNELSGYEYPLNEGGRYETNRKNRRARLALGIEFGVACALCGGIFLTNIFMPNSAINTFFRAMSTPAQQVAVKPYTEYTLRSVVSELSDAKLELSQAGVLSFQEKGCVYPAANGKVSEVTKSEDGSYVVKINHEDSFTGVFTGLSVVYYGVGESVKCNVPVGYTDGEKAVEVTMYADGAPLNCFELTEENCLAWVSQ